MKYLPWFLILPLAGLAYYQNCHQVKMETETVKMDTVYVERKITQTRVRRITDSILRTDTLFRDTTFKRLIEAERAACDAVVTTCEKRVANLKAQLKPGWLKVFGAFNYQIPRDEPALKGPLSLQGGASLRLTRNTFLEGYRDLPLTGDSTYKPTWSVRVRQEVRLF
jgi:hypothetical protein